LQKVASVATPNKA